MADMDALFDMGLRDIATSDLAEREIKKYRRRALPQSTVSECRLAELYDVSAQRPYDGVPLLRSGAKEVFGDMRAFCLSLRRGGGGEAALRSWSYVTR